MSNVKEPPVHAAQTYRLTGDITLLCAGVKGRPISAHESCSLDDKANPVPSEANSVPFGTSLARRPQIKEIVT